MKYKLIINTSCILFLVLIFISCQKMDRPVLGDFAKDANPPGGPLKFYTAFDGTTSNPLMNAVDSIRANFASANPLSSVTGISGKAIQGSNGKAVYYSSANDFKTSKSFSIAFWIKNAAQAGRTEFLFSLVDDSYGWHHSAAFLLMENQTATSATMKFCLMDQWLEGTFNKPVFDGSWHHIVYAFDANTSVMNYYFDGQAVSGMTTTQTNVTGAAKGGANFSQATGLVLAGWNKHVNAQGPKDDWISSYSGSMDQFRLYNKAISGSEALALFNSKL